MKTNLPKIHDCCYLNKNQIIDEDWHHHFNKNRDEHYNIEVHQNWDFTLHLAVNFFDHRINDEPEEISDLNHLISLLIYVLQVQEEKTHLLTVPSLCQISALLQWKQILQFNHY